MKKAVKKEPALSEILHQALELLEIGFISPQTQNSQVKGQACRKHGLLRYLRLENNLL